MLLFIFKDEADLEWVIKQSPWTFDKYLVVLQKPDVDNSIESMSFNSSPFWVQLHNVSLSRMSKENAESIRASIGEVEEEDVPASGQGYGRFLSIRVKVEIRQPLCRGRLVDLGDRDPIWVAFRYERLLVFCYKCGKLNHDERDCQGKSKFRGNQRSVESQYGPWLKVDPGKMQKTQVIEGQDEENEDLARNQDSSNMEISVKQVENQDRADIIVQGVGKGNLGIERLGESSHYQELNAAPPINQTPLPNPSEQTWKRSSRRMMLSS